MVIMAKIYKLVNIVKKKKKKLLFTQAGLIESVKSIRNIQNTNMLSDLPLEKKNCNLIYPAYSISIFSRAVR